MACFKRCGQSTIGGSAWVAGSPRRIAAVGIRRLASTTALVKCVVPIITAITLSGLTRPSSTNSLRAVTMPFVTSAVVGVFTSAKTRSPSIRTASVLVPPTSMPIRVDIFLSAGVCRLFQIPHQTCFARTTLVRIGGEYLALAGLSSADRTDFRPVLCSSLHIRAMTLLKDVLESPHIAGSARVLCAAGHEREVRRVVLLEDAHGLVGASSDSIVFLTTAASRDLARYGLVMAVRRAATRSIPGLCLTDFGDQSLPPTAQDLAVHYRISVVAIAPGA